MQRVLLLSNGHGEDLSGSLIGARLQAGGVIVQALPLVGHGAAYRQAGIEVLGATREFSTGGLGYTSLGGRLTELFQGQLAYLLGRLGLFLRQSRTADLVVVVGDVIPVLAAWWSRRPVVTYLVAYSSHYEGRLRLPWPCGLCLKQRRFRRLFSRDALTASDLTAQLGRAVDFLGNPFLDPALTDAPQPDGREPSTESEPRSVCLLPGSRLPEAERNLESMLAVLQALPADLQQPACLGLDAALVKAFTPERIAAVAARLNWRLENRSLRQGPLELRLHWGRFPAVLQQASLVLSMTGTAAEQAVGLGKPVIQLAGFGPQFTPAFAEAQRRLLGPSVVCSAGEPGTALSLAGTARLLQEQLEALGAGTSLANRCRANGLERIGGPGGSARMAEQILALLDD
ncbi:MULTISPECIES: lipid-A-disaccharide synthase-related protein [unclassified Synechococcus]|uniref:lipid-A-disaccharide synthase-related protein n=1 Tax=unclassified Synechococcus TaxID=2626047 RepID=UPI0021A43B45|nr:MULTISPECIES: lipid-A-disaccharide synthase-related protein [unclassified Synechococcus]MCT0212173.1 lipid-A-disaccharide synthase-related protein [Synechococcus sp. CS-1326]MCT0233370.1 lipid-A-disaccharide synthase-related protein [Synechococcus sp. CS-1327]